MKNLANNCGRCSRYGGVNLNRFAARSAASGSRKAWRSRVDAVEVDDPLLGGDFADLERIHHEEALSGRLAQRPCTRG